MINCPTAANVSKAHTSQLVLAGMRSPAATRSNHFQHRELAAQGLAGYVVGRHAVRFANSGEPGDAARICTFGMDP